MNKPLGRLANLALLASMGLASTVTAATQAPQRVFISGHSLVDEPLPTYLSSVAGSLGTPFEWNRQYVVGSSIRARAEGDAAGVDGRSWAGYRQGDNRAGKGMDVLAELRQPRTVSGGPYDALLITEQHGLLGTLVWNDTVRYLRHYHDRFVGANPAGRTWFYEPWLSLDSKDDPRRWIAYERAASPMWQCIVERINVTLAAEGRPDRLSPLPAGLALARLIERATQEPGLAGVSAGSVRATVDRLIADDVHLTPLGVYYVALATYASMFDRSPVGAWAPAGVDADTARTLQSAAFEFVQAERATRRTRTLGDCQSELQDTFIAHYWGYVRDAYWRKEVGTARAWWRWAKHRLQWHWRLRRNGPDNPLRHDPATDKDYWLPAP